MMRFALVMMGIYCGCSQSDSKEDSGEISEAPTHCDAGNYTTQLRVWSQSEEETFAESQPLCETTFEATFLEGGGFQSTGICEFERNGETRQIDYRLSGQHQGDTEYGGEVVMTRRNGNEESSTFFGHCAQQTDGIDLRFDWYILLGTPNGSREHHGALNYPIQE
ncbi:MAG: hypothetical protein VX278_23170 [Myxococcota bacterium]|nr:hypothetical protein [Myxococcota bacterium]